MIIIGVLTGHYSRVNLDDMQLGGAPVYRLSMIAEAYATKGRNTHLHGASFGSLISTVVSSAGSNQRSCFAPHGGSTGHCCGINWILPDGFVAHGRTSGTSGCR